MANQSIKQISVNITGDVTVQSETEAMKYQQKIEETLQTTLEINLKPGNFYQIVCHT